MKIAGLLSVILFFTNNSFGQELSEVRRIEFFNQSFDDYFNSKDSTKNDFYIIADSVPNGIQTDYDEFKIHLVDYNKAYPLIKKGIISSLYCAKCRQVSVDTIDVVIGGWPVKFERVFRFQKIEGKRKLVTKNYNFSAWCGGTLGYIPQGRFVYLNKPKQWKYISEKTIIENKLKKYHKE